MNLANDLTLLYAAWPATFVLWIPKTGQGGNGRAIFDQPGTVILGGDILATDCGLRYRAATFPAVRQGDAFVIDGDTYTARKRPAHAGRPGVHRLSREIGTMSASVAEQILERVAAILIGHHGRRHRR